jgi:hypothetical protein
VYFYYIAVFKILDVKSIKNYRTAGSRLKTSKKIPGISGSGDFVCSD